jgi:hypothetical protein
VRDTLYDLSMLLGAGLVVAGVALVYGVPGALISSGALVMVLTVLASRKAD